MRNSKEGKIESTEDTFRLPDIIHYKDDVRINIDRELIDSNTMSALEEEGWLF